MDVTKEELKFDEEGNTVATLQIKDVCNKMNKLQDVEMCLCVSPNGNEAKDKGHVSLPHNEERDTKLSYTDQYNCRPPPLFLVLVSLSQICIFVYHVILLTNQGETVGADGPVYLKVRSLMKKMIYIIINLSESSDI